MIRKCKHCGSSLLESVSHCSYCFKEVEENSVLYSLQGISHVYVKRENEKIFGPFPLEKVVSLVQTNKLKKTEWVSDDRNLWIEVQKCIEFLESDSTQFKHDLPGLKSDLPGLKSNLPGLKHDLPGLKHDLPGLKPNLPGLKSDVPSMKTDLPGLQSDLPGLQSDVPSMKTDLPGQHSDFIQEKQDAFKTDKNNENQSRDFSLPPIGGGFLPELKLDMRAQPIELKLDDFLSQTQDTQTPKEVENPKEMSSSLVDTTDGIDFSALSDFSGFTSSTPSTSGLSLSNEITLPIEEEVESSLEKNKVKKITRETKVSEKKSRTSLFILMLLLIIGVVTAYFINNTKSEKKETKPIVIINEHKVSKQEISDHERNILNLDYEKITVSSQGQELIHCESALALAWLFHDISKIESCTGFAKHPASGSDPSLRRYQFLRAMVMLSYPKSAWIEKIYVSTNPVDFAHIAEEILSKARSENQNSPFWRFVSGVWNLENGKKEKALEDFNFIRNTETSFQENLLWFSLKSGDETVIKVFQDIFQDNFWKDLILGAYFWMQHQKNFSFLLMPEGLPQIKIHAEEKENIRGPRFVALHHAFAALSTWSRGNIDEAIRLCDTALQKDEKERTTQEICQGLQFFHGHLGRFAIQIPLEPNFMHIASMFVDGRTQIALYAWQEWKKNHPDQKWVVPLINLLSKVDREEWKKSLYEGLSTSVEKTLDLLWVGIWQTNFHDWIREDLLAWKEETKYEGKSIQVFLDILDVIESFRQNNLNIHEKLKSLQISVPTLRILEAIKMQLELSADKKNSFPLDWLEKTALSMVQDVRVASVVIQMLTMLGKLQDAHTLLDKIQDHFIDSQLYKAASKLFLTGTRSDRLMRSRFFAEKAIKVNSQDFEALMLIGYVQLESGQFDAGEKSMLQAVSLMTKPDPNWFMRWSELESRLKRNQMALNVMDIGLQKIPEYVPFIFRKAQIFATQDKPKEALELLAKTKNATGIEEVQKYILEGRCHLSLRQKKEAEAAFAKAIKADYSNILARYMLGKTTLSNGKIQQSIPHLEEVVRTLEKIQLEQRIPEEAVHWQSETVDSMLVESYRLLGGAYKELGKRAQALSYFKKYASMVSDGPMKDEAMRMILLLGGE